MVEERSDKRAEEEREEERGEEHGGRDGGRVARGEFWMMPSDDIDAMVQFFF